MHDDKPDILHGTMIEAANRGCRLRLARAAQRGTHVTIHVASSEIGGRTALQLDGHIVGRHAPDDEPWCTLAVVFDALDAETRRGLTTLLNEQGSPSALATRDASVIPPRPSPDDPELMLDAETDPPLWLDVEVECWLRGDRREHARRPFMQSVLEKQEPAVRRILLARDLSIGGMRIDRAQDLAVGQNLRLALYDPDGAGPLDLEARVLRDDGGEGWALVFFNVDPEHSVRLEKLVAKLPDVSSLYEDELCELRALPGIACEILDD